MIGLIGLDHHATSAEVLGRFNFSGEHLRGGLRALVQAPAVREAVIVSTCNRTELYVAAEEWPPAADAMRHFLAEAFAQSSSSVPAAPAPGPDPTGPAAQPDSLVTLTAEGDALPGDVADELYEYEGVTAVRHLLQVAAGLRSMVVGEAQILGQVKEALAAAEAVHSIGDELRGAFALAIRTGKHVRSETGLGQADASVAALAVHVAREALGTLDGKSALLIGAGRTNRLCATLLRDAGAKRLYLANRTLQAAADLACDVDGAALALADVARVMASVQLVISATAAPHTVLSAATVADGMAGRRAPLVIIDLAVPPDVEDAAGLLPNVSLYTLDTLRGSDGADGAAMPYREAEMAQAERIVEDGVCEFARLSAMRLAVPGIAALRRHVDRSEQVELARALAQLSHLAPDDRVTVERFGQRLVDKMFYHLVSRIRSLAEYDEVPPDITMRVLSRLFADPATSDRREEEVEEDAQPRNVASS